MTALDTSQNATLIFYNPYYDLSVAGSSGVITLPDNTTLKAGYKGMVKLDTASFVANNITIDGIDFICTEKDNYPSRTSTSLVLKGYGTIRNSTIYHWCNGAKNQFSGVVTFDNSRLFAEDYGVDSYTIPSSAYFVFENSEIYGFYNFYGVNYVTIRNSKLHNGGNGLLRFYRNVNIIDSVFDSGVVIDTAYLGSVMPSTGISITIVGCKVNGTNASAGSLIDPDNERVLDSSFVRDSKVNIDGKTWSFGG